MFDHEQLKIWQRSHALAIAIHLALRGRSRHGPAGLASQLSRSSLSIAANIAEAAGQATAAQSARYVDVTIGSISETQSHLAMAEATGMIESRLAQGFIDEARQIRRMTFAFRKWLLTHPNSHSEF